MKTAAVIAEYNPFHNGHLYQLNAIRGEINADCIIVLMSGDFVQRGEPAIIDKYARCEAALRGGADLVIELPSYFALGSAEYFANGAVSLLDKLGVIDVLHFGSECGDIGILTKYASCLASETPEYKKTLNMFLRQGFSFPTARSKAMLECFHLDEDILSKANNSLAIEYIKAVIRRKSSIKPVTLLRKGGEYDSKSLTNGEPASAKAIRHALLSLPENSSENTTDLLREFIPDYVLKHLISDVLMCIDDFSGLLHYKLLSSQNLTEKYYDVNETLTNTIFNKLPSFTAFSDFVLECKSKNLTYSHICRGLMHIILDMTDENACLLKENDYSLYARVLGFSDNGKNILKSIKANSSIPIITKPSKALKELDGISLSSFKSDINVTNIYNSVRLRKASHILRNNTHHMMPNELTRELIRI